MINSKVATHAHGPLETLATAYAEAGNELFKICFDAVAAASSPEEGLEAAEKLEQMGVPASDYMESQFLFLVGEHSSRRVQSLRNFAFRTTLWAYGMSGMDVDDKTFVQAADMTTLSLHAARQSLTNGSLTSRRRVDHVARPVNDEWDFEVATGKISESERMRYKINQRRAAIRHGGSKRWNSFFVTIYQQRLYRHEQPPHSPSQLLALESIIDPFSRPY